MPGDNNGTDCSGFLNTESGCDLDTLEQGSLVLMVIGMLLCAGYCLARQNNREVRSQKEAQNRIASNLESAKGTDAEENAARGGGASKEDEMKDGSAVLVPPSVPLRGVLESARGRGDDANVGSMAPPVPSRSWSMRAAKGKDQA